MKRWAVAVSVLVALMWSTASGQSTYGQRLQGANGWLLPVASRLLGSTSQDHIGRGSVLAWDVSASVGTPIFPIADGVVEYAGCNNAGGYGCWAYINHGNGYKAIYAHIAQGGVFVKGGQKVSQWDVIGQVGLTGKTSWPHTHLEVSRNGSRIDPAKIWNIAQMQYCKFCKSTNGAKDAISGVQMVGNVAQAQPVNQVPYWWMLVVYLVLVGAYAMSGYSKWSRHAIYHGLAMFTAVLMFVWIGGVLPNVGQGPAQQVGQISAVNGGDAWKQSYAFMRRWEGKRCVHDPVRTLKGVTQGTYNAWRKSQGLPAADVCTSLTDAEAEQIYYQRYWVASGADKLPMPVALTHFDFAVNAGVGAANRALSQCGTNATCYNNYRKSFYLSAKGCALYCAGWLNRLADIRKVTG